MKTSIRHASRRAIVCALPALAALALGAAAVVPARAQVPRYFPANTKLGTLEVTQFPMGRLDGRDVRFGPGLRIFDTANMILMPTSVAGKVIVRYRVDMMGQVNEAWILTPEELRLAREEARQLRSAAQ